MPVGINSNSPEPVPKNIFGAVMRRIRQAFQANPLAMCWLKESSAGFCSVARRSPLRFITRFFL
jgi:hypothetical protein